MVFDAEHTAYSCGGSPGFEPEFPLNPRKGNLSCLLTVPQLDEWVNPQCAHERRRNAAVTARLTVMVIAGRLAARAGVHWSFGHWVKREAGQSNKLKPALPPQR